MLPFTVLTAVAAPLEIAKIDTGMILPGRFMRRHRRPGHDYSDAFLHDLRFDDKGRPRADSVLNMPAYRGAKILVTDSDFGCGSSREGAAYAVMDYGLRALIGPSRTEFWWSF
jgi:3-isopropylmalate/(R)-2-methylmalate dehydratase small subunit